MDKGLTAIQKEDQDEEEEEHAPAVAVEELTCHHGKWTRPSLRCSPACLPPRALSPHASVVAAPASSVHGSRVVIRCDPGYSSSSNRVEQEVTCRHGRWEMDSLDCRKDCGSVDSLDHSTAHVTALGGDLGGARVVGDDASSWVIRRPLRLIGHVTKALNAHLAYLESIGMTDGDMELREKSRRDRRRDAALKARGYDDLDDLREGLDNEDLDDTNDIDVEDGIDGSMFFEDSPPSFIQIQNSLHHKLNNNHKMAPNTPVRRDKMIQFQDSLLASAPTAKDPSSVSSISSSSSSSVDLVETS